MYKLGLLLLIGIVAAEKLRGDDEPLTRMKRQIPEPNLPTFGPDVERTADGVPILDESYLARKDRPAARFFSQFEPEKEGLRLYDSLLDRSSGGRPELRSLDGFDAEEPFGGENGNGLQSSQSGSWTRKTHSRRTSRKSIQVKSANGGTTAADLPSGFGPSTGPQFSEEVNYQRTTNANKLRRNSQLRSLDSNGNNGYSCTTCRRHVGSDELPGATELKTLTRSTTTNANGHETEGLRLYKKLLRSGGSRNQLRSLDTSDQLPQNGILPHHRQSAAWSQKEEQHQSFSRNQSSAQTKSGGSPSEITSGFGASTGSQFSDETTYRRSNSGRRTSSRNASQTRSLSSSSSQPTSNSQNNGNGLSSCVTCRTRSSTSTLDESPVTYHRSSRVPSTGDYLIPTTPASSHSWAEREERSHSSSRSFSRTINGVETNGLGEPLVSAEEATYRRVASGGSNSGSTTSTRNLRSGARTLSTSDQSNTHSASRHSTSDSSNTHTAARTLSVAGAQSNGNGRSRRYNCSRISTTSLSEGAQSVAEIVTPPPCVIRRSDNQLQTRASTRSLNLPYPPVQTLGRGDQEVHARVLESDHENDSAFNHHESSSASERHENENHEESSSSYNEAQPTQTSYKTGRKHKKAYYRRTVFKNYTTAEYPASVETWLGA